MSDSSRAKAESHHSWVLVAGTGLRTGLPSDVCLAAAAVGEAIARFDCGLVTGGWPGVDFIAAEAFASVERAKGSRLEDRLVQVVREDRPVDFDGGRVVRTSVGPLEWLEPQSYCDAIILIGGIGGTYGAFLSALHKGIPRFPLGGTGGDAAKAFQSMCELWEVIANPAVSKSQFEALGHATPTREAAVALADRLLPLVIESIAQRKGRRPKSVFVSYSRTDAAWLQRIRATLQPLERTGRVEVWADDNLDPGSQWEPELHRKMSACDIAILMVSPRFLQSEFVTKVELPLLLERARAGRTHLLWILLDHGPWQTTGLRDIQAACDTRTALNEMAPADVQISLVKLRQEIEALAKGDAAPEGQ